MTMLRQQELQAELAKDVEVAMEEACARLEVGAVDTSSWTEFADFFQKPLSKSFIYEFNDRDGLGEIRRVLACSSISVVASTKEKAMEALRADLVKLTLLPWVEVKAFLCKPSTIKLAHPLLPFEGEGDTTVTIDLSGPRPAQTRYAAFCFLHGRQALVPLDRDLLLKLGLEHAVYEGEVGKFVG